MILSAKRISILLIVIIWFIPVGKLLAQDTLRVMYYNILNYPGSTPERVSHFRIVNMYVGPDILLVNMLYYDSTKVTTDKRFNLKTDSTIIKGFLGVKNKKYTMHTDVVIYGYICLKANGKINGIALHRSWHTFDLAL